jgi:hypothetical protein
MNNKAIQRNVIPATALAAASTTTSAIHTATWGRGVRFYITVSAVTAAGGIDKIFLCGISPGTTTAVPMVGFSAANMLAVAGIYTADFIPGSYLPPTIAAGGSSIGVAGIEVPLRWAVQVIIGTGNAATIAIDAEMIP